MTVLTTNLRQLYQRRGLWLVYAAGAAAMWFYVRLLLDYPLKDDGHCTLPIILNWGIGLLMAFQHGGILGKPMAFCLPGHRQNVRAFVFLIGIVTSSASAAVFLLYPGLPPIWRGLVLASAFFANLTFYLIGVVPLLHGSLSTVAGLLSPILFLGTVFRLHVLLERAIVMHPLAVIALGGLVATVMWLHLTNLNLVRRTCLRPSIGFATLFDEAKSHRSPQVRDATPWDKLKDHPRPWVETLFINKMRSGEPFGMGCFIWGTLYRSFSLAISHWRPCVVGAFLLAIPLGYSGPLGWLLPAYLALVPMGDMQPTVYWSLLIAGGRRERFVTSLTTAVAGAGLLWLFIAMILVFSRVLALVLPDVPVSSLTLRYRAISFIALCVPLTFVPLGVLARLLLYRKPLLKFGMLMLLFWFAPVSIVIWSGQVPRITGGTVVLTAACCWLVYILVLHRIAYRGPLVK